MLTTEALEGLRLALPRLDIAASSSNAGAMLPDQTVSEESIASQTIEGYLTAMEVSGTRGGRER
jgi:hypothetical protein